MPSDRESSSAAAPLHAKLEGAFGASLPARFARYGKLVDAFGATLPARFAR